MVQNGTTTITSAMPQEWDLACREWHSRNGAWFGRGPQLISSVVIHRDHSILQGWTLWVAAPHYQINSVWSNRQVRQQLASQVSKNTLNNFDRIVTITHCTSPIKVGANVGTAFLHISPYDESHMEALPFKLWKSWETDVGRVKLEIGIFIGINAVG